jgi:hypothetical protein
MKNEEKTSIFWKKKKKILNIKTRIEFFFKP